MAGVATKNGKTKLSRGHAEHTKDADQPQALPGKFQRPLKITVLGAGSGFTPRLSKDFLLMGNPHGGEIALVDVDGERLSTMKKILQKLITQHGLGKVWKVTGSTDRRKVMAGSDYLTNCIEVSGLSCVAFDNDIPLKYGVDQCIGDTIGPGGLFKSLRTVPVWLEVLRDVEELCPGAMVLNYTNPMSIMCLAAGRAVPGVPVVGLCHSVQGTSHLLANYAEVPYEEMEWDCAGINHLAWFTRLKHNGRDLYATKLHERFRKELAAAQSEYEAGKTRSDSSDKRAEITWKHGDLVRKDMCLHFGAFITESSGHLSEYLPYYRKSAAGRKLLRTCYDGGSRFYATNWPTWRRNADKQRAALLRGEEKMNWSRTWEYASWIIEAREKDSPVRIYGNVMNRPHGAPGEGAKLITNLPGDGCVEVACMIDRNGIHPTRYGALPAPMAHICASNMAMFDLAATACIERSKEAAIHSLMLDPMTAAILTPAQIKAMTLEMFDAEKEFLPGYR